MKNEKQKLDNDLKTYIDENKKLNFLNKELSDQIKLLQLNNLNNNQNRENKDKIMPINDELKIKDNNINELKDLIPVIFQTEDKKITYAFICKKNDKFNKIENNLYEVFPELEEDENIENNFKIKGKRVLKARTMAQNNINYSDIVILHREKV